ncbi:MAG: TonB-dependent receptor [Phycisphaerae bacterium]|nr:TonB-dependent receptor [Phycisphaerae bacterium]
MLMTRTAFFLTLICGSASQTSGNETLTHGSAAPAASQPASAPGNEFTTDDIDLLTLEVPIVVTASRHEQKINTLPFAATIITAEDIRASGARNVPDALRLAAGVDVADITYNIAAVSPRGGQGALARKTLVLVDGRQVFDTLFGGTLWGNWPFQLEDIARIEIIRGPGGVTWGANAVYGVINIITKDPAEQQGLTVTGGGGSRGAQKEHLGYGFSDHKLRLRVSGEYEGSDGFRRGGSLLAGLEDDLKIGRSGVHAIYDAGPADKITLSGGHGLTDGGVSVAPLAKLFSSKNPTAQASFILGKWEHQVAPDNQFALNAYVNDYYACHGTRSVDYRYQQIALQFTDTIKNRDGHTLTWGLDTRTDLLDASNSDPYLMSKDFASTAIIGLYVNDEWQFAPRWRLDLGARIDYEFYGGFEPSGRVALSRELSDTSFVYAAVARAFQMPPLGIRFMQIPMLGGLAHMTSDQDVDAEQVIAYELGYRGEFFKRLQTNANLFCNQTDNMYIGHLRPGPPGLLQEYFENGVRGWTYGAELDARYPVNPQLTLLGNYTFERFDTNGSYRGAYIDEISQPRHKFMVGTRYSPLDRVHLSAHLYYVDSVSAVSPLFPQFRQSFDSYFRLDLRGEYEFWKDRGSVAVGVRNLLDPDHPEGSTAFSNHGEAPRMVYAEVRLVFK